MLLDDVLWPTKSTPPLLVIEHDLSRSAIRLLRALLRDSTSSSNKGASYQHVILASFLHPANILIRDRPMEGEKVHEKGQKVHVFDYTDREFGLEGGWSRDIGELRKDWMAAVDAASAKETLLFIIDDLDAMALDVGARPALILVQDVIEAVKSRRAPSRTVVAVSSTGTNRHQDELPIAQHILTTSFSPALTHLRLYPPVLLTHLSKAFLLPPPPRTPTAKFYGVFGPFTQRDRREAERLWYADLDGGDNKSKDSQQETVVEVVVRSPGLRKAVDRTLDGWVDGKGACPLEELPSLRECFAGSAPPVIAGDTKNATEPSGLDLPFNLNLTDEQVAARAKVPLPYAHTGEGGTAGSGSAAIYYDPDSADDLDEEDPDEDLL